MKQKGGRRPGAGAPKGNLNALKTGAHSKKVRELLDEVGAGRGFYLLTKEGGLKFVYRKEE